MGLLFHCHKHIHVISVRYKEIRSGGRQETRDPGDDVASPMRLQITARQQPRRHIRNTWQPANIFETYTVTAIPTTKVTSPGRGPEVSPALSSQGTLRRGQ